MKVEFGVKRENGNLDYEIKKDAELSNEELISLLHSDWFMYPVTMNDGVVKVKYFTVHHKTFKYFNNESVMTITLKQLPDEMFDHMPEIILKSNN